MSSISVTNDFEMLCRNLRMDESTVSAIQTRYQAITKRINQEYWDSDSCTQHSLYVGSYGRGTAIFASDVDIVVQLPWTYFDRYDKYSGNGQSALLQDVKKTLQKTYSTSAVNADGQVIDISFSDGMKFEVVPAFMFNDGSYYYADTNNGGCWRKMDPRAEIAALNDMNNKKNKNVKRMCRMVRAWNKKMNVLMPGYLIDTTVYRFMNSYKYADKSYAYYDWFSRDYFQYLMDNSTKEYWLAPGSLAHVTSKYGFFTEAKQAHDLANEALEAYDKDWQWTWRRKWRAIYGTSFPE